jgi:hypothetical protein
MELINAPGGLFARFANPIAAWGGSSLNADKIAPRRMDGQNGLPYLDATFVTLQVSRTWRSERAS